MIEFKKVENFLFNVELLSILIFILLDSEL